MLAFYAMPILVLKKKTIRVYKYMTLKYLFTVLPLLIVVISTNLLASTRCEFDSAKNTYNCYGTVGTPAIGTVNTNKDLTVSGHYENNGSHFQSMDFGSATIMRYFLESQGTHKFTVNNIHLNIDEYYNNKDGIAGGIDNVYVNGINGTFASSVYIGEYYNDHPNAGINFIGEYKNNVYTESYIYRMFCKWGTCDINIKDIKFYVTDKISANSLTSTSGIIILQDLNYGSPIRQYRFMNHITNVNVDSIFILDSAITIDKMQAGNFVFSNTVTDRKTYVKDLTITKSLDVQQGILYVDKLNVQAKKATVSFNVDAQNTFNGTMGAFETGIMVKDTMTLGKDSFLKLNIKNSFNIDVGESKDFEVAYTKNGDITIESKYGGGLDSAIGSGFIFNISYTVKAGENGEESLIATATRNASYCVLIGMADNCYENLTPYPPKPGPEPEPEPEQPDAIDGTSNIAGALDKARESGNISKNVQDILEGIDNFAYSSDMNIAKQQFMDNLDTLIPVLNEMFTLNIHDISSSLVDFNNKKNNKSFRNNISKNNGMWFSILNDNNYIKDYTYENHSSSNLTALMWGVERYKANITSIIYVNDLDNSLYSIQSIGYSIYANYDISPKKKFFNSYVFGLNNLSLNINNKYNFLNHNAESYNFVNESLAGVNINKLYTVLGFTVQPMAETSFSIIYASGRKENGTGALYNIDGFVNITQDSRILVDISKTYSLRKSVNLSVTPTLELVAGYSYIPQYITNTTWFEIDNTPLEFGNYNYSNRYISSKFGITTTHNKMTFNVNYGVKITNLDTISKLSLAAQYKF